MDSEPDQPAAKVENPLFVDSFSSMDSPPYEQKIVELLREDDAIYRAWIRDSYQLGRVLNDRKYRYLAYGHRVFLVGIMATFAVAMGGLARDVMFGE